MGYPSTIELSDGSLFLTWSPYPKDHYVVLGVGRAGAEWLHKTLVKHNVETKNNRVDIGVRVETNDIIMNEINEKLYEGKFLYRTSVGTSFQNKDNTSFDVLAALSGTVVEIKDSPLYGNYIVLEHNDKLKTYYYSLSEVTISVGTKVAQGDKIGVSGNSEIDKEAGNHVYFKIVRDTNHLNPERVIGKKPSEI